MDRQVVKEVVTEDGHSIPSMDLGANLTSFAINFIMELFHPAMQNLPNAMEANAGCVQSDACIECLRKADSYSGKHSWRGAKCDASCYPDGAVADEAVKRLNELKDMNEPFFLAVGFKRPHLGWMAPQSYFDLYDVNNVSLAKHRMPPKTCLE